jgi:hypothetical protein
MVGRGTDETWLLVVVQVTVALILAAMGGSKLARQPGWSALVATPLK